MAKDQIQNAGKHNVKALIIRAAGTNCDQETIHALTTFGVSCELAHINQLLMGRLRLHPYQIVVFPGGFSYGDDISAGKVFANELKLRLQDQLKRFVESKKLIIGICNGFQVLVKAGLLPGFDVMDEEQTVTLAINESGHYQCEWVGMKTEKSAASWLDSMPKSFELPIAHGEGRFLTLNLKVLETLKKNKQIVFQYAPKNPNGSQFDIAGLCNKQGNVIGLMPHPERYLIRYQHPNWTARRANSQGDWGDGYLFWQAAVNYAKSFAY
ncbi:MAG: phosphoribosylformylglycinamidine synthase I [Elusimicrobiota bacterium]